MAATFDVVPTVPLDQPRGFSAADSLDWSRREKSKPSGEVIQVDRAIIRSCPGRGLLGETPEWHGVEEVTVGGGRSHARFSAVCGATPPTPPCFWLVVPQ